jgi:transcriptional regulator with XRE-family HTH domain
MPITIGQRIQRTREERGMSASELARLVHVTPTAVWNWERNGTQPRPNALAGIARALGVTTEFLISGDTEQAPQEQRSNTATVAQIIENAKAQIAALTGYPLERVRLQLQLD